MPYNANSFSTVSMSIETSISQRLRNFLGYHQISTSAGRRNVKRDKSKAYKEVTRLKLLLAKEQPRTERYQKRAQKSKRIAFSNSSLKNKAKSMIKGSTVKPKVRRALSD